MTERKLYLEDPRKFTITSFRILGDFVLEIVYEDGTKRVVNFGKLKREGFWEKLQDLNYFNQVKLSDIYNLEWPNGEDFHPGHFYYWEEYEKYYLR
ncbi:MAG: DUF2442 domain-containing protein [Candidatus Algichlamydia australiensis]|nr:DUF2442 domain-containing protein [Chlamydiales bacterium]